ncbi:Hypothetical_protein [Hexamita inflata]|uniref:Hypothetical_protein n=1 Tax=Hexamita inflata TaxID=28002 RepID=A0AA86QHE0_9EUKA|nr:Hypothetical protein HINF_LOCUS41047 [Hexamita inflata]
MKNMTKIVSKSNEPKQNFLMGAIRGISNASQRCFHEEKSLHVCQGNLKAIHIILTSQSILVNYISDLVCQSLSIVQKRAHVLNPYFKLIRRIIPFYFKVIKFNYLHRQLLKLSVTKTEFVCFQLGSNSY